MLSTQTSKAASVPQQVPWRVRRSVRPFSWKSELKELCSPKFFNIAWWPLFRLKQPQFTRTPLIRECKKLPGFENLWNTIQKSSFAYNCLFLGMKPYQRSFSSTDLVDITTLALFFGDEFIDGICKAAGKTAMRELLGGNPEGFYLKKEMYNGTVKLVYAFDINTLLSPSVMQQVTPKYGISYTRFYQLLEQFLAIMNEYLAKMTGAKAQVTAEKIVDVCNTCLQSYLHDIEIDPTADQISKVTSVLQFHEIKTRFMQEKFLELRCILANKEAVMESEQTQGWLDIMRVVQIYDDLQDVVEDDGYQDNLVISVAYHKFKEEWSWLKANRPLLQNSKQRHFLLSVFMPQTVSYCLKIAAARMGSMNWEQQKIIHYLLFKNWFVAEPFEGVEGFEHWQGEVNFLLRLYQQLQFLMPDSDKLHIKAHLIHSCFHMDPIKRMLRKKLNLTNYYQLRYNLLMVSPQIKSKAFDRITGIAAS